MVWQAQAPYGGFSSVKPWLPVKPPQAARAVDRQEGDAHSVLAAYRAQLAFRKARTELMAGTTRFLDLGPTILGIERAADGARLICLFNLSPDPATLRLAGTVAPVGPSQAVELATDTITFGANGFMFLEAEDGVSIAL
jgi:alpha-glucosidase